MHGRRSGAGKNSCNFRINVIGNADKIRKRRVVHFRISAIEIRGFINRPAVGDLHIHAVGVIPGFAQQAFPARDRDVRNDVIPDLQSKGSRLFGVSGRYPADKLMSDNTGSGHGQLAVVHVDIRPADPACNQFQLCIALRRLGDFKLPDFERSLFPHKYRRFCFHVQNSFYCTFS